MGVFNGFAAEFAVDEFIDHPAVDGAGTVKSHKGGDLGDIHGLKIPHNPLHPFTFQLEHTVPLASAEHGEGFFVIQGDFGNIDDFTSGHFDIVQSIANHRQVAESQKVHFQQTHFLHGFLGELSRKTAVVPGLNRQIMVNRFRRDNKTCGVKPGMTGHPFDLLGADDELFHHGIVIAHGAEIRIDLQRFFNGHPQVIGDLLGHLVRFGIRHIQHAANVADGQLRLHRTESDDLGNVVVTVFIAEVLKDLASSFNAEIRIDIGHGDTGRIQKPFKKQGILERLNVGDPQGVGHDAPRRRTAAGAHHDPVFLGVVDHIPDDQEVTGESHLQNHAELVLKAFLHFALNGAVTFRKPGFA